MQVSYNTGAVALIDGKDATPEKVKEVRQDPAVTSYAFHKPGSTVEMAGGRKYQVQKDGSWRATNKPRSRVKRLREERAARKRP